MSPAHGNTELNNICTVRIDVIESLTRDGFLNNNDDLKQWFHHKYPTCQYNNYEMSIVDNANVKHSSTPENDNINTNFNYKYEKKHGNEIGIKVNTNAKLGVFDQHTTREATHGMQHLRRDIESARSLIGEWDGSATSGTFTLSNGVNTTETIGITGRLEIIGIISMDGKRPAIDGGGTPGCTGNNCPGHTIFIVRTDTDELQLSNLTIKNGYVSVL